MTSPPSQAFVFLSMIPSLSDMLHPHSRNRIAHPRPLLTEPMHRRAIGASSWNDMMPRTSSRSMSPPPSRPPAPDRTSERGRSPTPRGGIVIGKTPREKDRSVSPSSYARAATLPGRGSSGGVSPRTRGDGSFLRQQQENPRASPSGFGARVMGISGGAGSREGPGDDSEEDSPMPVNGKWRTSREKKLVSFDASVWRKEAATVGVEVASGRGPSPRRSKEKGVTTKKQLAASKVEDLLTLQAQFTQKLSSLQSGKQRSSWSGSGSPIKGVLRKEASELLPEEDRVGGKWETPPPPKVTPRSRLSLEKERVENERHEQQEGRVRLEEQLQSLQSMLGAAQGALDSGPPRAAAASDSKGGFLSFFRKTPPKAGSKGGSSQEPPPFDFTDDSALVSLSPGAAFGTVDKKDKEKEKAEIQQQLASLQSELTRMSEMRYGIPTLIPNPIARAMGGRFRPAFLNPTPRTHEADGERETQKPHA